MSAFTAVGFTTAIAFQAFLIVGGCTRLLPLTGVTLPFMSQGGSSLLASFIIVGLLLRTGDEATGRETAIASASTITAAIPGASEEASKVAAVAHGSNVRGRTHRLDPEGTTFGTLPQPETGSYVADVDNSVSNEHLRIWEEDGRWLAEGLGSLHGTYIQRGNERIVVEPPADELGDFSYESEIEVLPGDVIVMGTTSFEVLYFNWGE
jgi:hypothetical protein